MSENNYLIEGKIATSNYSNTGLSQDGGERIYYTVGKPFEVSADNSIATVSSNEGLFNIDMAQSSFFTLEISDLMLDFDMFHHYSSDNKTNSKKADGYGRFLPVKSLDYNLVSMENKQFDAGIFRDIFIIEKKKMGVLNITLTDTSDNKYERAIIDWFNINNKNNASGYVGYLVNWARTCIYREYNVKGELTKSYKFSVLPSGDVRCSRAYDQNTLKEISFTVIIASDIIINDK